MNRLNIIIAAAVLFFQSAFSQTGEGELLRNGGFEEGFGTNGISLGWQDDSGWAHVQVRYSPETSKTYSGRTAQKIECLSFESGAVQFRQGGKKLKAGESFKIRLALKGELQSLVEIQIRKMDKPYTTYFSYYARVGPEWKLFEFDGQAEESDDRALFMIRLSSAGTLWLDEASLVSMGSGDMPELRLSPRDGRIPETYFGMHVHQALERFPIVPFKTLRLWDAGTAWPNLEKEKGVWDFSKLDAIVERCQKEGVDIILGLALSPKWASARPNEKSAYNKNPASGNDTGWAAEPARLEDWQDYVKTMGERYKGKIRHYEIWNEVNEKGFYSGTADKLIELTREAFQILKAIAPENKILSPSVVGNPAYFELLQRKGMSRWSDIASYHFYNWDHPEKMIANGKFLASLVSTPPLGPKPLWNTESGWYIESHLQKIDSAFGVNNEKFNLLSFSEAGDLIIRSCILFWALGVDRNCFYAWDNGRMGLVERDGSLKPTAKAYEVAVQWLKGKILRECFRNTQGVWAAKVEAPDGKESWILWTQRGETTWTPPSS
ncbi:MAG: beta-galactosidase, partial [Spirochaetia bacterium]|nr:beta-galactosidase [Spirochaetia bacterium]